MPSEKQLLKILEKDTVDTASWRVDDPKEAKYAMEQAEGKLYSLAAPQVGGTLRSYHVTDDPVKSIEVLRNRGDFYVREGDLCGGLYVSTVPHFWEGRSERKWDFLPQLSKGDRATLYGAVYDRLVEQIASKYITQSEFDRAQDTLALTMTSDRWQILSIVANQPYNIDIPKLAKDMGLAKPFEPHYVPVDFTGRYLEFNTQQAIEANEELLRLRHGSLEGLSRLDLCNMLKDYGWDGVYTKASMGTNPELVIWSGDKILRFGDWSRESSATLGAANEPTWISDPLGESRFEALVSPDSTRSMIFDKLLKESFDFVSGQDLIELAEVLEAIGAGEPLQSIGRFESRLLYGMPQIHDAHHGKYFRGLRPKDMDDLEQLIEKLAGIMR